MPWEPAAYQSRPIPGSTAPAERLGSVVGLAASQPPLGQLAARELQASRACRLPMEEDSPQERVRLAVRAYSMLQMRAQRWHRSMHPRDLPPRRRWQLPVRYPELRAATLDPPLCPTSQAPS